MALALYRKYRSKRLDEIVGQDHITAVLSRALVAGRVSHAYLFTGPRGVGKTSVARILAHEINHLPYTDDSQNLDIIEIDAASNNGVEDVRDLREKVQLAPVAAEKKVYIIDEVHMLSKAAFNALLKTLEEPPQHVVFILATTDVDKLPATIISRTQRFHFRAITPTDAIKQLRHIADEEEITISDEALRLLAELGDGSFRDSISLLDQLSSLADEKEGITAKLVETTLGLAPDTLIDAILSAIEAHTVPGLVTLLYDSEQQGVDAITLANQLARSLRRNIAERPQLLSLLDGLLDVPKSSQPSMKLLIVLASASLPKQAPKTVALAVPTLGVSATVEELSKPTMPRSKNGESSIEHGGAKAQNSALAMKGPQAQTPHSQSKLPRSAPFDWQALLSYAKEHYVAVYSVLSKCQHTFNGDMLTIYTNNAFYKKKLDDPKYSTLLYESLTKLGCSTLDVHILPTAPPPKDSQAAAVAAIMGGGEEVSLDEAVK